MLGSTVSPEEDLDRVPEYRFLSWEQKLQLGMKVLSIWTDTLELQNSILEVISKRMVRMSVRDIISLSIQSVIDLISSFQPVTGWSNEGLIQLESNPVSDWSKLAANPN
jgi:hypothetical protein